MVQGASLTCLTASGNGGVYGLIIPLWRRHSKLSRKNPVASGFESQCPLHLCPQGLHFRGNPNTLKRRNLRVEAGWLFNKGGEQELDASSERSENANEDILIFFFQLDLATRVQVEGEVIRQQEAKRGSSSKSEAQDKAISIIRLRADLQNAIEKENYAVAAELRDQISKLEAESLAATAKALVYENAQYAFRLGQKVKHQTFGYRAVVCGMDPICCESSSWMETARVEKLARGSSQPFYQVLVDVHEDPNLLVAYVPEENLVAPEKPDTGRFDHPYISFLFYGMDTAGDFIPIKQLREKYNKPRHEVPMDRPDDDSSGGADA